MNTVTATQEVQLVRISATTSPFLPAITHLKMSSSASGHLADTPSRRQSGETGRVWTPP